MSLSVAFENVGMTFRGRRGSQPYTALADFTHTVAENEFLCLLGPSGCGKSTVLNLVGGFAAPTSGRILVGGKPIGGPGPDRGMVFQQYALFPWYTVQRNVELGLEARDLSTPERRELAERMLRIVGLWDHRLKYPKELSGGMRQRAAIARTLVAEPDVILMDEPFAALDAQTREHLQYQLLEIWEKLKRTVIFVTHSVQEAVLLGDRVTIMGRQGGNIVASIKSPLPRPRNRLDDAVVAFEREIHRHLELAEGNQGEEGR